LNYLLTLKTVDPSLLSNLNNRYEMQDLMDIAYSAGRACSNRCDDPEKKWLAGEDLYA
jgi:hypothetical protein